ncbi:MAG: type II secretion system protein [Firmicutes bacterium]|nr:type II secretion system protein [Bacillota bacterium]
MKRKGFTLIELLAVIVVLTIIALIATPIVRDIIDKNNKKSAEISMTNMEKAAELYFYNNQLLGEFKTARFVCKNGVCKDGSKQLDITGQNPDFGIITIDKNGNIVMDSFIVDGHSCTKLENGYSCDKAKKQEVFENSSNIVLNDRLNTSLYNYTIYGNSIQDGTPNLSENVSVESLGEYDAASGKYKIPVKVSGKNLFKESGSSLTLKNQGTLRTSTIAPDNEIILKPGTYKLTIFTSNAMNLKYRFMYSLLVTQEGTNKEFYLESSTVSTGGVFTVDKETKIRGVYVYLSGSDNASAQITINNIQLEKGNVATEYEPYIEPLTTNIYLDEPLRKIGDYADYIDFSSGKIVRKVGIQYFDGTENWVRTGSNGDGGSIFYLDNAVTNQPYYKNIMSNHFKNSDDTGSNATWLSGGGRFESSDNILASSKRLYLSTTATTLTQFKSWLGSNDVYVLYSLKKPLEKELELPNIKLFEDYSRLEIDAGIKPSGFGISYYKKIS